MSTIEEMNAVVNADRRYVTVRDKAHFREVMDAMKAKGWTFLTMVQESDDEFNNRVVVFIPQEAFAPRPRLVS